jgi:alkyl sulfatase BDS1-like metallo-beta-lactamase superfamily hydrolase
LELLPKIAAGQGKNGQTFSVGIAEDPIRGCSEQLVMRNWTKMGTMRTLDKNFRAIYNKFHGSFYG